MHYPLIIALSVLAGSTTEVQLKPLSGPSVDGRLLELDDQQLVVETSEGLRKFERQEVLTVAVRPSASPAPAAASVLVQLADGSRLAGTSYSTDDGQVAVTLTSGDELSLRPRDVHWVRFQGAGSSGELEGDWESLVSRVARGDMLVVRREAGVLDQLEGVVVDVEPDVVQFEFEGESLPVPRARLEGVIYYRSAPAAAPPRPAICQLREVGGTHWDCRSLRLTDGRVQLVSVGGVERSVPLEWIAQLDFSGGNVRYLSDLEPESVEWVPYVGSRLPPARLFQMFQPRRDRGLTGEPLTLDGVVYDKGLAIHSRTTMVYRLPDDFRRLHAVVGIDDRVRTSGSVRLVIAGDGRTLFDQPISGLDDPLEVDLDIRGVRRLSLLVDFHDQLDIADHLNLCDARITK